MKTILARITLVALLLTAATTTATAKEAATATPTTIAQQDSLDFFTVAGTVRDSRSRHPLPNVSVSVPGSRVGTVTNSDGSFTIKIKRDTGARQLQFSLLGYDVQRIPVDGADRSDLRVMLSERAIEMSGVTVVDLDARALVDEAVRRIGSNYSDRTNLLTGFYRETVRKRNSYIDIAEAVVEISHTPYSDDIASDRLRVVKGRRLISPRASDTLAVKLQGGPHIYLINDIVKNRPLLLDGESLDDYRFRLESPAVIDDRLHHTVVFSPAVSYPDHALLQGTLYIDREDLTISRAEYSVDMSDRNRVTTMILRQKPASLRFTPDEVSYVLNYQKRDGRSYLYYIGTSIRFHCDWRRRLFATGYTVSSETVITDGRDDDVRRISFRDSFRPTELLGDRVGDLYDSGFWEHYNIIEPTESLEVAVRRLRRQNF
jgi:hypothetical protein